MSGDSREVIVRRKKRQVMPNAELRQDRIDGANLDSRAATAIAKLGGLDMVLAVWRKQRQGAEALDDLTAVARPGKALEQLLQHQASGDHRVAAFESAPQGADLRQGSCCVAPKGERPGTCIYEQRHLRERSFL